MNALPMLQRYAVVAVLSAVVAGCVPVQAPTPAAPSDTIQATFICPDGTSLDTVFDNAADTVTVNLPDGTVTLPRAESGSGARYSDGTTTFWNKGNAAMVEVNGVTVYENCVTQ